MEDSDIHPCGVCDPDLLVRSVVWRLLKAQAIALVNEQLAGELEVSEMELSVGQPSNVSVDLRDGL